MKSSPTFIMAFLLLAPCVTGCRTGDGLVEVSGTVTVDKQPVERGTIRFEPVDGQGPTQEAPLTNGEFKTRVAPGEKNVTVNAYKKIGEHHVTGPDSPLIDDLAPIEFKEPMPIKETIEADLPPRQYSLSSQ